MPQQDLQTNGNGYALARGLGWFSIGLGIAEVVAPRQLANVIGVPERNNLIRLMGLREIGTGVAILNQEQPSSGLWSRVGGDAIDLALLGSSFASEETKRGRAIAATAAVALVTVLDIYSGIQLSRRNGHQTMIQFEKSITIDRSAAELYNFWHSFENLPRVMNHLRSVKVIGDKRSHWVAKGPAGTEVEWTAVTTIDQPNREIAWQSLEDADVDNSGSVRFERAPGGRGTIIRVKMSYKPPAGKLGSIIAKMFGEFPEKQIPVDLHRFKQLMETGEIARTEGQSAGRARSTSVKYDDYLRQ